VQMKLFYIAAMIAGVSVSILVAACGNGTSNGCCDNCSCPAFAPSGSFSDGGASEASDATGEQ
jgi:hypothetical protein